MPLLSRGGGGGFSAASLGIMKRHLAFVALLGVLLWIAPVKANQFDVTLLGGATHSDRLQLTVPESYITLQIDAKNGDRGGLTVGVHLLDMSPARSFSAEQRRDAAPDFASITLSYEPREDLVEVEWISIQSRIVPTPIRTDIEAGFEEYEAKQPELPKSFYWLRTEHAYSECFAAAPNCNVRTYISNGVYAEIVMSKTHLQKVGAIRKKVRDLIKSFKPQCVRASGVRGQCTDAQPSFPADVPASAASPLRPGRG